VEVVWVWVVTEGAMGEKSTHSSEASSVFLVCVRASVREAVAEASALLASEGA
jgi:hypothetical protein